jgi:hypothetical protein
VTLRVYARQSIAKVMGVQCTSGMSLVSGVVKVVWKTALPGVALPLAAATAGGYGKVPARLLLGVLLEVRRKKCFYSPYVRGY